MGLNAWFMTQKDIDRFWSKVVKTDTCWEWQGALDGHLYGKFVIWEDNKHKYYIAHRVAWKLTYGDVNSKTLVCHHCDNTKCINPSHLFIGSAQDNSNDMVAKGRHEYRMGVFNPNAKLSREAVDNIRLQRTLGVSAYKLAEEYGISPKTVWNICNPNQKCWTTRRKGL